MLIQNRYYISVCLKNHRLLMLIICKLFHSGIVLGEQVKFLGVATVADPGFQKGDGGY